jgi:hypothetical protein
MTLNEDEILDEFRSWLRNQPIYVVSEDRDLKQEQIDDAPFDYIDDFCRENKYNEKIKEELLNWILFRNEVYVFLEENGII